MIWPANVKELTENLEQAKAKLFMRKNILVIISLFFLFPSFAQDTKVQQWKTIVSQGKKDTTTLIALDSLIVNYGGPVSDSGFYYYQQMKIVAEAINNNKYLRIALWGLAQRYFLQGKTAQALQEQYKSLAISEALNDSLAISNAYLGIGNSYKEYGDFLKSLSFYKKGYEIALAINDEIQLHVTFLNLGYTYAQLNKLDSALYYAQQAYTIGVKRNRTKGVFLPIAEIYLGDIQFKLANYQVAEGYYSAAYTKMILEKQMKFGSRPLVWVSLGLANCYKVLNNIDSSFIYAKRGLTIAKKIDYLKGMRDAQKVIAELFDANHQIDSAYYFQKLYVASNDSLYNRDKSSAIESLNFEKILEEKQKQTEIEKQHKQRQHNIQLAVLAISILLAIIIFLLLSNSFIVSHKVVGFLSVLVLLVVFEFVNLLLHPFLENITHDSPVLMLLALVAIAALIIPMHHRLEHFTTKKLVEKNKAIRLAKAKKTIEEIETSNEDS